MGNLVGVDVAAKALGVNRYALYKAAARGKVAVYRLGKSVRFDVAEIREQMRQGEQEQRDAKNEGDIYYGES